MRIVTALGGRQLAALGAGSPQAGHPQLSWHTVGVAWSRIAKGLPGTPGH